MPVPKAAANPLKFHRPRAAAADGTNGQGIAKTATTTLPHSAVPPSQLILRPSAGPPERITSHSVTRKSKKRSSKTATKRSPASAMLTKSRTEMRLEKKLSAQRLDSPESVAEKKKVALLAAVKPENQEAEKYKFFKADFEYDPQFIYRNPPTPKQLEKHSSPNDKFIYLVRCHFFYSRF